MKIDSTPTKPLIEALDACLRAIRRKHNDVPNVVLVVASNGRKPVHGHFMPGAWSGDTQHEIVLSAESLKRGPVETLGTLIHECAHALAVVRGIQDTSRQGRYHNGRFKKLGEELGIQLDKDDSIGWSLTTVPSETQEAYAKELEKLETALSTYRIPDIGVSKKKSQTVKIECACRSVTVPISFWEQGTLTCDACGEMFDTSNTVRNAA